MGKPIYGLYLTRLVRRYSFLSLEKANPGGFREGSDGV
jgi:hypothetical protein